MPCRCATSCATAPLLPSHERVTTRGILANRSARCEIGGGVRRRRPGCRPSSAAGRPGAAWSSSTQPQLSRPCSTARSGDRPAEQRRDGVADRGAVGDGDRELAGRDRGEQRRWSAATIRRGHLLGGLAAGDDVEVAAPEGGELLGRERGVLVVGQPLPVGEVVLTQPGVVRRARGRSPWRRTPRSARARTLSEDHSAAGASAATTAATAAACAVAGVVELGLELALDPARGVPGGLAVPEQDADARGAQRSCETTSAGSAIDGQSRQSRSRA